MEARILEVEAAMALGTPSVRPRSLSLSLVLHGAAVGAAGLLSTLGADVLPKPVAVASTRVVLDATPLRLAPRPIEARSTPRPAARVRRPLPANRVALQAGGAMPRASSVIRETDHPLDGAWEPVEGACTQGCVVGPAEPGPTAGEGVAAGSDTVVSIVPGGDIKPPRKLRDVPPTYPDLAVRTRAEGRVAIECRIDTSGRVVDARVMEGHPLLSDAALAAVRQWTYTPTLLNGVPVSVIMTVTVHFRLRH
jgi:protein TonB